MIMTYPIENYYIRYPYHLCPVCGMQSETTSGVCSKHISVTYDSQGNVIDYKDYVVLQPVVRMRG